MCKAFTSADQITLLYYLVVDKVKIMRQMVGPQFLQELFGELGKVGKDQAKYLQALEANLNTIKK